MNGTWDKDMAYWPAWVRYAEHHSYRTPMYRKVGAEIEGAPGAYRWSIVFIDRDNLQRPLHVVLPVLIGGAHGEASSKEAARDAAVAALQSLLMQGVLERVR